MPHPNVDVCAFGYVTRELEVYPDGSVKPIIAGPPYYFSIALLRLGDSVRVVTRVAEADAEILEDIKALGGDVVNLPTGATMKSRLLYRPGGREIEVVSRADPFKVDDLRHCPSPPPKFIYLGPLTTDDFSLKFLMEASRRAPVVLDVQGFTRRVVGRRVEYVDWEWKAEGARYVSMLKLDDREGKLLTGRSDPEDILDVLKSIGFKEVLLTTSWGIHIMRCGERASAPYKVREVRGRTGRGDTATAAYVHARIRGWGLKEAATFTAAATSVKLLEPGPLKVGEEGILGYVSREYGIRIPNSEQ